MRNNYKWEFNYSYATVVSTAFKCGMDVFALDEYNYSLQPKKDQEWTEKIKEKTQHAYDFC